MSNPNEAEKQHVQDDVQTTLLEGRTILRGVQTLFGFQLSVLFTPFFQDKLSRLDQIVHFAALTVGALTIAVVIMPAAYHRRVNPGVASRRFTRFANQTLMVALALTTVAMSLNFYLITDVVFRETTLSWVAGAVAFSLFGGFWFVLPSVARAYRSPEELEAAKADPKKS